MPTMWNNVTGRPTRANSSSDWYPASRDNSDSSDTTSSYAGLQPNPHTIRRVASVDSFPEVASLLPYWSVKRHLTCGNPSPLPHDIPHSASWRLKDKLKTSNAALVLCLNIDVDPPDVVKTNPCATLECWVDPHSLPSNKALEAIGTNLHHQFEGLSPRIKYKPYLDPSYEDTRKFCLNLRKMAKDERTLFYYNGHGVPKPTPSGELWVFNKSYSQYIPVSLVEIQNWLGSPCVYIWDCSAAGHLLSNFKSFAERRDKDINTLHGGYPDGMLPFMESIQLAACGAHEQLPMCPELPADLFTSCLTSPIDIALRYFIMHNQLPTSITADMVMQLPGDLKDRRTPLGELNWIFTAITDTIAWTTFSKEDFTRLYRTDLLVASLFRNFLLAERIMKDYGCTPHTYPPLPPTKTHSLWATWDLAVDGCLAQLPDLLRGTRPPEGSEDAAQKPPADSPENPYVYVPSRFFEQHLTAFEVWISRGGSALTKRGPLSLPPQIGVTGPLDIHDVPAQAHFTPMDTQEHQLFPRKPPDQLPIILQVLLSQHYRLRALVLLAQFVDLGPWAVHLALTIGIFPYISKLLQAPAAELRPVLIFIWARILAVDPTCKKDLLDNHGYKYFAVVLGQQITSAEPSLILNSSEHMAACAFILSAVSRDFPDGQSACWRERVFDSCFERLDEEDFLLRQWSALCIGQMWAGNDEIRLYAVDRGTQDKFVTLLTDRSPEVRTAVLFALSTFLGASGAVDSDNHGGRGSGSMYLLEERIHFRMEVALAMATTLAAKEDASPMVRKELVVLLSCLVKEWRGYFVVAAWIYWEEDRKWRAGLDGNQISLDEVATHAVAEWLEGFGDDEAWKEENRVLLSSFFTILCALFELSVDPYAEVALFAETVVDYVMALLLESPFTHLHITSLSAPPAPGPKYSATQPPEAHSRVSSFQTAIRLSHLPQSPSLNHTPFARSDSLTSGLSSGFSSTLRRTASFANSLKSLASGHPSPTSDDGHLTFNFSHSPHDDADLSRHPSPNITSATYASPYAYDFAPGTPPSPPFDAHKMADYAPADAIEALIEEDLERFRLRRKQGVPRRHQEHQQGNTHGPSGSTISNGKSGVGMILGLGPGAGIRDVLPLKSRFFDWCVEYFREPQMRQQEADEPGSVEYNEQMWRRQRNEKVVWDTLAQAEVAPNCQWDRPIATLHHSGAPIKLAFHTYDTHLVVASEANIVAIWDWSHRKRLNIFNNGNSRGTKITALEIINQDVGGLILTGASDGVIRLYRNYDPSSGDNHVQMVSAFRALNEVVQVKRGTGLVLGWNQSRGLLLSAGDSRIIRAWDAHQESSTSDINTDSESPLTSIAFDPDSASTFMASFADGTMRVFDRRLDDEDAVVRTYREHSASVQNVRWQRSGGKNLLSASADGEIRLWDIRGANRSVESWILHHDGLSSFDVHDRTGVFAASSSLSLTSWRQQTTVIHSLPPSRPTVLSRISLPSGLAHAPLRDSHSTNLAFHPTEMLVGIGGADGTIKLVGCKLVDSDSAWRYGLPSASSRNDGHGQRSGFSIRSFSP